MVSKLVDGMFSTLLSKWNFIKVWLSNCKIKIGLYYGSI